MTLEEEAAGVQDTDLAEEELMEDDEAGSDDESPAEEIIESLTEKLKVSEEKAEEYRKRDQSHGDVNHALKRQMKALSEDVELLRTPKEDPEEYADPEVLKLKQRATDQDADRIADVSDTVSNAFSDFADKLDALAKDDPEAAKIAEYGFKRTFKGINTRDLHDAAMDGTLDLTKTDARLVKAKLKEVLSDLPTKQKKAVKPKVKTKVVDADPATKVPGEIKAPDKPDDIEAALERLRKNF